MTSTRARRARMLGNLLIASSFAAVLWWAGTMLYGAVQQRSLGGGLPHAAAATEDVVTHERPAFEVEGWEREDGAYWRGLDEGGAFGRLVIERMDLDRVVVKGASRTALWKGPGWLEDTELPFTTGNAAISGHRTTWGAPFWSIDTLRPGDTVDLYSPFRRYRYEVEWTRVVRPGRSPLLTHTSEPSLTLTACEPKYSAAKRIVVRCRLVGIRRLP